MELILTAPKDAQSAVRFCRCAEKAATMKADGYTIVPLLDVEDALFVHKPLNQNGIYQGGYAIDLLNQTCNCPDFTRQGFFCKHLIFVAEDLRQEERSKWEAICAEVEAVRFDEDIACRM